MRGLETALRHERNQGLQQAFYALGTVADLDLNAYTKSPWLLPTIDFVQGAFCAIVPNVCN